MRACVQLEIMDENTFEREPGTARVSQNYVKLALASLMPVVLETLSKQDEDSADDLEHWDLGKLEGGGKQHTKYPAVVCVSVSVCCCCPIYFGATVIRGGSEC